MSTNDDLDGLVARRIRARQAAEGYIDLLDAEVAEWTPLEKQVFWANVRKLSLERSPLPVQVPEPLAPFTNSEAREFGKTVITFGRYKGHMVDGLLEFDPKYLRYLAGAPYRFSRDLVRYLRSPLISQLLEDT